LKHLIVRDKNACEEEGPGVEYKNVDLVDCEACKATELFAAAMRICNREAYYAQQDLRDLLAKLPHERIKGPLGDHSVIKEGMSRAERAKAVSAAMTPEEKVEHVARMNDMCVDTCPGCGGSIMEDDHDDDCLGSDPDQWELTDEQQAAETRVYGVEFEQAVDSLMERFKKMVSEHRQGGLPSE